MEKDAEKANKERENLSRRIYELTVSCPHHPPRESKHRFIMEIVYEALSQARSEGYNEARKWAVEVVHTYGDGSTFHKQLRDELIKRLRGE